MRDLVIALSLSNLLALRGWEKFRFGGFLNDFKPDGPSVAISVLLCAFCLWIGWRMVRTKRKLTLAARIIFVLSLLIPVNALRLYFSQSFVAIYGPKYSWMFWAIAALLALPIAVMAARRKLQFRFLVRYGVVLVLLVSPFVLFTLGGVLIDSYRAFRSQGQVSRVNAIPAPRSKQRVVWIIFDELDDRIAFRQRPASLALPEFDRLRAESMVASAAYPPGGQTGQSVPALLDGKKVRYGDPVDENRLALLNAYPNPPDIWNSGMTIFSETSASGIKTGLAGVYFPYCAILGRSINDCRDYRSFRKSAGYLTRLSRAVTSALDAVPFVYRFWLAKAQRTDEIFQYEYVIRQASLLAADQSFDFVYIHLPIPHPPPIYNRHSARIDISESNSYLDNLALADVAMGELRGTMEQSGAWEKSTVIVTSDHWWRTYLWNGAPFWSLEDQQLSAAGRFDKMVPFIVKLKGNHEAVVYDRPFNTVITRKMIMAMLREDIATSSELMRWLDKNATDPVEPSASPDMPSS